MPEGPVGQLTSIDLEHKFVKRRIYTNDVSDLVVHLTYNGQRKDESYFISQDGKHLAIWEATGGSNAWMLEVPPAW